MWRKSKRGEWPMGDTGVSGAVLVAAIAVIVNAGVSIGLHIRRGIFEEALAAKKLDYDAAIAQRKLRLDLFDKRFAIFNAARTFLGRAIALGKVEGADEHAFMIGTLGALFLLNDDLGSYLEEMQRRVQNQSFLLSEFEHVDATVFIDKTFRPAGVQSELEDAQADEKRNAAKAKYLAERNWLLQQSDVLVEKFKPFLKLDS
jgi:hypothetical protein